MPQPSNLSWFQFTGKFVPTFELNTTPSPECLGPEVHRQPFLTFGTSGGG
jgi:hypothetical protein